MTSFARTGVRSLIIVCCVWVALVTAVSCFEKTVPTGLVCGTGMPSCPTGQTCGSGGHCLVNPTDANTPMCGIGLPPCPGGQMCGSDGHCEPVPDGPPRECGIGLPLCPMGKMCTSDGQCVTATSDAGSACPAYDHFGAGQSGILAFADDAEAYAGAGDWTANWGTPSGGTVTAAADPTDATNRILHLEASAGSSIIWQSKRAFGDLDFQVRLRILTPTGQASVNWRFVESNNRYRFRLDGTGWIFDRPGAPASDGGVDGGTSQSGNESFPYNQWHIIRVQQVGSTINLYFCNTSGMWQTLAGPLTDPSPIGGGTIVLGAINTGAQVDYDDVQVLTP